MNGSLFVSAATSRTTRATSGRPSSRATSPHIRTTAASKRAASIGPATVGGSAGQPPGSFSSWMPRFGATADGRWRNPATDAGGGRLGAAGAAIAALAPVLASGNSAASRARVSGATVASIPVRGCHIGEGHQIFSQFAPRQARACGGPSTSAPAGRRLVHERTARHEGLQIAALANSKKNFLTVKNVKLRVNIVMLFVRQPSRKATRAALYATWSCRERLFGGHDNVDPAGGSRTISMPKSQILEPLTSNLGGASLEPFFIGSRESRPGEVDLGGFFHFWAHTHAARQRSAGAVNGRDLPE